MRKYTIFDYGLTASSTRVGFAVAVQALQHQREEGEGSAMRLQHMHGRTDGRLSQMLLPSESTSTMTQA